MSMVALAPNTSETGTWDVLDGFPKLHSRAREVKTTSCTEAMHSKSLDCVEIWQAIYDCRARLESFTRDPMKYRGSRDNLYEYCSSSPVIRIDPEGTSDNPACDRRFCTTRHCCNGIDYDPLNSCCDGKAVINYRSCEACCAAVLVKIGGTSDFGFAGCCDGRWCACNTVTAGEHPEYGNDKARKIIANCVNKHENTHFPDDPSGCKCGESPKRGKVGYFEHWDECDGYRTEYSCLGASIGLCNGDRDCETEIRIRQDSIREMSTIEHGCWGILWW